MQVITPLILFLLTFFLYVHHLSPSVYGGDVGDFLSAIAVKGVPHPSGYPLFTILGILFSYLPFNQTFAWKIGLISSISSSFSVVLMYLISKLLAKNILVSIITALTLAFYYNFWLYAEIAEVFALNNFFILLLLYLSLSYFFKKNIFFLYLLSFFAGLSLSNHEVISLLFPPILILVLKTNWKILLKPKILLNCFLLFFIGLLPYIYIPLVVSHNENFPINWVGSATPENILRLIFRLDYGWKPAAARDFYLYFLSLKTYFNSLIIGLTLGGVGITVLGMIFLIKRKNIILFFSLLMLLILTGPLAIIYVNTPIFSGFTLGVLERFYMISALVLLIFFPLGILLIVDYALKMLIFLSPVSRTKLYYRTIFSLIFLIIPVSLFISNYLKTDLHDVWIGDYLAQDVLLPLPKNSTLFLSGDTILFNTFYTKYALGIRKDITIINLGTLEKDENFIKEKEKIANKKRVSKESLNTEALSSLLKREQVFSNVALRYKEENYEKPNWVPYGLLLKNNLLEKNVSEKIFLKEQEKILGRLHLPKKEKKLSERGLTFSQVPGLYAQGYVNIANYLVSEYQDAEKAKIYYEKAISFAPDETGGYLGLGYYFFNKRNCVKAEDFFNKVIFLNPGSKNGYIMLYATYDSCFNNAKQAKKTEEQFFATFKTSILKEIKKELNKE